MKQATTTKRIVLKSAWAKQTLDMSRLFNKDADFPQTRQEIREWFLNLTCALSPENLHCDGEISRSQAAAKYRKIMTCWRELEKHYGEKVTEDQVWQWEMEGKVQ